MNEIIRTLREERQRQRITQKELADKLKMSQSHLAAVETQKKDPRLTTVLQLARALHLEPMLIPKALVPAVGYLISSRSNPAGKVEPSSLVGNTKEEEEEQDDDGQKHR